MKERKDNTGSPVSTAVGEPVLTNEQIAQLNREAQDQSISGELPSVYLARAVEREVVARLAAPTQAKPVDLSEIKVYGWTDEGMVVGEGRGKWCKFADVKRLSVSKKAARIGCEGTGKSVGDMPCLGCDACPEFAAPTQVSAPTDELKQLRNRVSQLEAARIGYASEFPMTADGEPDVGNIHANIRALKAQVSAPQADEENVEADAYMHACDLMEQFQKERAKRGVEIGTQGSLCDGIAWLFNHIKKIETAQVPQASAAQEVLHEDVEWLLEAVDMARRNPEHATKIRANCKAGAAQEVRAVPDRRALLSAAVDCGHSIDENRIVLHRDRRKEGNALKQLGDRLNEACANLAAPTSTSTAPAAMDEKGEV